MLRHADWLDWLGWLKWLASPTGWKITIPILPTYFHD